MQELLNRKANSQLTVLVVWEPILPTDWRPPSKSTMARVTDRRVRQFWDPDHLVATALSELAKQKPGQPQPECCVKNGFHWDEAILYGPEEHWKDAPGAAYWNGPVWKIIPGLENTLASRR